MVMRWLRNFIRGDHRCFFFEVFYYQLSLFISLATIEAVCLVYKVVGIILLAYNE